MFRVAREIHGGHATAPQLPFYGVRAGEDALEILWHRPGHEWVLALGEVTRPSPRPNGRAFRTSDFRAAARSSDRCEATPVRRNRDAAGFSRECRSLAPADRLSGRFVRARGRSTG